VSGQSFGAFVEQRLLQPAGMKDTSFAPPDTSETRDGVAKLAQGYTSFALGEAHVAVREADGWTHAAGAMYSTASDLARWDLALIDGKILKPASLKWMLAPRTLPNGRSTHYGCGLAISTRSGETVVQHSGAVSGFLAYNAMVPRTRSAVVLLSNREDVASRSLHDEILALVIKSEEPATPRVQGPPAKEMASTLMKELQSGTLDRSRLAPDFDRHLNEERMRGAVDRLKALGEPKSVELDNLGERGGMEVAVVRFTFATTKLRATLYRSPDGKVQQFLLTRL
jgi:CubicO group peptidase (beta-lactamase class C family)